MSNRKAFERKIRDLELLRSDPDSPSTREQLRKALKDRSNHFVSKAAALAGDLQLTGRDREVLDCLAKGYYYKEIADSLSISINTVRKHLKSMYDKLHVHSRTEAILKYVRR